MPMDERSKRSPQSSKHADSRSWKLLTDPAISKCLEKTYRFDGLIPGSSIPVVPRDPRYRVNLNFKEPVDLYLPKLRLDGNYVGKIPPRDVTFAGLNDNINESFLKDMCRPFGQLESVEIISHPVTRKHLGVGRALFCTVKSARLCVEKLHKTVKMGKTIQAWLDVGGSMRKKIVDEIANQKSIYSEEPKAAISSEISEHSDKPSDPPRIRKSRWNPVVSEAADQLKPAESYESSRELHVNSRVSEHLISQTADAELDPEMHSSSSSSSEDNDAEESLEQRIQALLGGTSTSKSDSHENDRTGRVGVSIPIRDNRSGNHPTSDDSNSLPPLVAQINEPPPVTSVPFSVPPVPPPFHFPPGMRPPASTVLSTKDQHGTLFENTGELLISELRRTLYRDICRRLMEQCAFRYLDSWWLKNEICAKTKKPAEGVLKSELNSQANQLNKSDQQLSTEKPLENGNLTSMFRQGGLFGLRDTIPKLPSFRRKDTKAIEKSSPDVKSSFIKRRARKISDSSSESSSRSIFSDHSDKVKDKLSSNEQKNREYDHDISLSPTGSNISSSDDDIFSDAESNQDKDSQKPILSNISPENRNTEASPLPKATSPVTSPQKPKARWAMFVQEQDVHPPPSSSDASKIKESTEPIMYEKTEPVAKKKSREPVIEEYSSDSSTENDNFEESTENEEKTIASKRKQRGRSTAKTKRRKVTPGRPPKVKGTSKEPLQQVQQLKHKTIQQPTSPRKPVVRRVNTVPEAPKEEPFLSHADSENSDDIRLQVDPLLPTCLIDHCYVELKYLRSEASNSFVRPRISFKPRSREEEELIATSCSRIGIDHEDLRYLERSFEELLQNYSHSYYWLNETHWVKHPVTTLEKSLSKHQKIENDDSTCARCDLQWRGGKIARPHGPAGTETVTVVKTDVTQGGIDLVQVSENHIMPSTSTSTSSALERLGADIGKSSKAAKAELREARSHQRRLLACFSSGVSEEKRDILGFNLLKYRKKRVRFARSGIHGWGLYALEPIAAEEMVVEYAGELIRKTVGDLREKKYATLGVDGSYMFRVDEDLIVDATMAGNYGRFINHSCAPNCYAKVITVDGRKKIVIYSKREISVSEEITYDYKFQPEPAANKIVCHCGALTCRHTLN